MLIMMNAGPLADDGNRQMSGVVDDSAWRIMKKVSPNYVFYDSFD